MNSSSCKCKCTKKISNIEVITYNYDPKCLAKLMKDQRKRQPSHQEGDMWKPLENIVGKKLYDFKVLQCLFTSKSSNRNKQKTIDQSTCEQKSTATLSKESCKVTYNEPIKHNAGLCPVKTRTDCGKISFDISKTRKFGWQSEIVSPRPRSQ